MVAYLVDTHAHLSDSSFDADREAVLRRASAAGIAAVLTMAESPEDCKRCLSLATEFPQVLAAAGLHPQAAEAKAADDVVALIRDASDLVAIGEVGLDFWIAQDEAGRQIQREVFERLTRLSVELGLPLNVHSRSAGRQAIELLMRLGARKVQMHAFDGRASTAMPAAEAGFFFSIPPSIVRSRQKQKLVERLPLSCLLLESDSPALGPDPTGRNEPANLQVAVRAIAEIKKVPEAEVRAATWENAVRLYGARLEAAAMAAYQRSP